MWPKVGLVLKDLQMALNTSVQYILFEDHSTELLEILNFNPVHWLQNDEEQRKKRSDFQSVPMDDNQPMMNN